MIIDGSAIAREVEEKLRARVKSSGSRRLAVIVVGNDPASIAYTKRKKQIGESIGLEVLFYFFEETVSQEEVITKLEELGGDKSVHGIIVQLPLPKHFDTDNVLSHIPREKDVDALAPVSSFSAPVALAVEEILKREEVGVKGKRALVVGQGRLVGKPVAKWLKEQGAKVTTADVDTKGFSSFTRKADIVVTGAGSPDLIKPEMLKNMVVLIDAGTSEEAGRIVGDADPACAEKSRVFTPVPGGVGPIAVVMLFKNLLATER